MGARNSKDIYLKPKISSVYSYSLNAETRQRAVATAETLRKRSSTTDVSWKNKEIDGVQSAIGFLKLFSDKLAISLKTRCFPFYPFYVTLLNISEEWRQKHISSCKNVCAYLPVSYVRSRTEADHEDGLDVKGHKFMKPTEKNT